MDQKDHLGEILRLKERAEEDLYFAARDRELLARLKHVVEAERDQTLRAIARAHCPVCGEQLNQQTVHGVGIATCPSCAGMWLDQSAQQHMHLRMTESWMEHFVADMVHLLQRPSAADVSHKNTSARVTS